jgi:hypothetical protein
MELKFKISKLKTNSNLKDSDFYSFIAIDGSFEFYINSIKVLKIEDWNFGELAIQLLKWKNAGFENDFLYFCMDAEEKDLFSFKKSGNGFIFYSEWSKNNSEEIIDIKSIETFILNYIDNIKKEMQNYFGINISKHLQ